MARPAHRCSMSSPSRLPSRSRMAPSSSSVCWNSVRAAPNKASESGAVVSTTPASAALRPHPRSTPGSSREDLADGRGHARQRHGVDAQLAFGALGAAQVHGAVDLAALELAGEQLAQVGFQRPQLLRQPEAGLQVAVIHAAQLGGQGSPAAGELAPCESRHACNHWRSEILRVYARCGKVRAVYQTPHPALRIEYAEVSLLGNRTDNQDRVSVAVSEHSALLVVIDGMGGHSDGAKAAETAHQGAGRGLLAHAATHPRSARVPAPVARPGARGSRRSSAPICRSNSGRAPPARVCLVQNGSAFWAHIGDSRVYLLRRGQVVQAHARSQPRRVPAARRA